jgi:hypothetical protein
VLSGNVNFTTSPNVSLGSNSNVHITGGSAGQVLQTDGTGNLTWYSISATTIRNGNSNVTIPTANGNVYINATGADQWVFDVTGNTTFPVTGAVNLGNLVTANYANVKTANISNVITLGNTSINWASVTTMAITANQTIATVPVSGITAVEFFVKGVDSAGAKYSAATVQALTDGVTTSDFVIYGTTFIGATTGTLTVNLVGGNIALQVTPASSNSTVWTTQFRTI